MNSRKLFRVACAPALVLTLAACLSNGAATLRAQTEAVQPSHRARISSGVMAGQLVSKVSPVYPPDARAQGISGLVVLHAIIGKDGSIASLTPVSGPDILSTAAIEAVQQWRYKPYLLNGDPTEVDTLINVNFNLGAPPASGTTPDPAPHPLRISTRVLPGLLMHEEPINLPAVARASGLRGMVDVRVVIGEDGKVRTAEAMSGPDIVRPSAVAAVMRYRYRPFLQNGQPTAIESTVMVPFDANR